MSEEAASAVQSPETDGLPEPAEPQSSLHAVETPDGRIDYTATFGFLPIRNTKGKIDANLSFTSYTAVPAEENLPPRPLTFMFNGGPGSASVWLHMGGLGPRRIRMEDDGGMPVPPFDVIENPETWLAFTDLVFIDPVDTGYSKAATPELTEKFLSVEGDLDIDSEFIRLFLGRFDRWDAPLFLGGESYGTFRSAGIAGKLVDHGVVFNGIILISSVLELGTLLFESGDDLPYALYPPSYAATAWYHQRLAADLQGRTLAELLEEVETWSLETLLPALAKGASLDATERQAVVVAYARFTGMDADLVDQRNLRVDGSTFCKELLGEDNRVVGRLDSRHTGFDPELASGGASYDPSMSAIRAPFTAAINQYFRRELGYHSDDEYQILRSLDWNWGKAEDGAPRTDHYLEKAFAQNPSMSLLVTSGFYDLATAYFATRYTLNRLNLGEKQRNRITLKEYPGGHMTYVAIEEMKAMRNEVEAFIADAQQVEAQKL